MDKKKLSSKELIIAQPCDIKVYAHKIAGEDHFYYRVMMVYGTEGVYLDTTSSTSFTHALLSDNMFGYKLTRISTQELAENWKRHGFYGTFDRSFHKAWLKAYEWDIYIEKVKKTLSLYLLPDIIGIVVDYVT